MMTAGKLDRRIQFRRFAQADDGFSKLQVWSDHGHPVWASKTDMSDGERIRAAQVQSTVTTRFGVRWSPFTAGITAKDRLTCDGIEYDITGVKETGARQTFLEITAAVRTDERT
jgi:SPP1 family predicted phage head-tail adaptor